MEQNPSNQSMVQQHHRSISSLPHDIFQKIIPLLNIPENTITISDTTFNVDISEPPITYKSSEFWNNLDNIFTLFTTPSINTFRIHLHHTFYVARCVRPILNSWARRLLARNNFQHISIKSYTRDYFYNDYILYPPSVFQIRSLVSLDLDNFILQDFDQLVLPPIILPSLKKLVLGLVYSWFFEWLFTCCPSIEDLSFVSRTTPNNRPISISSKNLKRLSITILSIYMSNLDYFDIIIDAPTLEHLHYDAPFLSMRMFDLIPNVKSVQIIGNSTIELHNSRRPTKIILPSLTQLTLQSSEIFKAIFEQQMLHCPNLEVLELRYFGRYFYDSNWNPKDKCMLVEHVKRLELCTRDVRFDQRTLNLVTWFLRSAPVLEKLILSAEYEYDSDGILSKAQFRKTLFECAEDTSGCQIVLFGKWHKFD